MSLPGLCLAPTTGLDPPCRDAAAQRGRLLAAQIPGARYVSLPSANHLVLEEEPARALFLEELGLFLDW